MSLILPLTEILKPQNMSRRGFLRFLGITTTIAVVPKFIAPVPKCIFTTGDEPWNYKDGRPPGIPVIYTDVFKNGKRETRFMIGGIEVGESEFNKYVDSYGQCRLVYCKETMNAQRIGIGKWQI